MRVFKLSGLGPAVGVEAHIAVGREPRLPRGTDMAVEEDRGFVANFLHDP